MTPYLRAKLLAVRRRISLAATGRFDPFPPAPADLSLSPSQAHVAELAAAPLRLAWTRADQGDPAAWQNAAREKLTELTGYWPAASDLPTRHLRDHEEMGGLRRKSFYLTAGPGLDIPVSLLWRDAGAWPRPAMICLQGTNSGMHLSWGVEQMPADPIKIANGGDYARQAAARGYLTVCIEQRCFGERAERVLPRDRGGLCATPANHALLLGRCLAGERASDVSSVVGWLIANAGTVGARPEAIYAMGNSAGGATAVLTGALDPRIAGVLASGCVGYIRETIAVRPNFEGQNVIPGILEWLEMDDIVALCAPRPFLAVAGYADHIWPFAQAEAVTAAARAVYEALGAGDRIAAAPGPGGHRFYPEIAWDAFASLLNGAS
ncbi:MAG: hypothetical protein HOK81_12330 [Rhodospirillaceae bacterium]|nr:hypothetical protein [Rhodospirillaceae bacterium]